MQATAATMAGNALGEGDKKKLTHVTGIITAIAVIFMTVSGALLFSFPEFMMSIFTKDPQVIAGGITVLKIVAVSEPLFAILIILEGIFNGLDASLKNEFQLVFTGDMEKIDEDLLLFSNVIPEELFSHANQNLYREQGQEKIQDDFSHEQNLIICEGEKRILIAGCSHAGILNIKRKAENILGKNITHIIAGFHLYNPSLKKSESDSFIHAVGKRLEEENVVCYTCHCTGEHAYQLLCEDLHEKIGYLATGSSLVI